MEHVKLEASAAEEQALLYDQSDLRIEVVELTRLAAIKVIHIQCIYIIDCHTSHLLGCHEDYSLFLYLDLLSTSNQ